MSRRILLFSMSCFTIVALVVGAAWVARGSTRAAAAPRDAARAEPSTRLIDARRPATVPVDAALAERAAAAARALEQRRALEALAAAALRPRTGVDWDAIARCETGGNWRMQGSRFSGGVGFANTTWNSFGGRQFAPNAGMATREQQIVVAERVYDRYGLSGWGCRRFG
jgi:hypothetical protein